MVRPVRGMTCGLLAAVLLAQALLFAQSSNPTLRGVVTDPSGTPVPAITVQVLGAGGKKWEAQTDELGRYSFRGLPPGLYSVTIHLPGFNDFVRTGIQIGRGKPQAVNARLVMASEKQEITVTEESNKLDLAPSGNASAISLRGKELDALSDDPDDLQSELQALAGPTAGPNAAQIYVDGFSEGEMPPKSSIREIRINQNPFSAQYDTLGYGRIEILTKPGTAKLHGQLTLTGNDSAFNTRNPFAGQVPGYHTESVGGFLGGPINSKTSFFFSGYRRDFQNEAIVNALVLDPALNPTSLVEPVAAPQTRTTLSQRVDTQLGKNDTLTLRYALWENNQRNSNVGQFILPEAAYGNFERWQSLTAIDSHVLSERAVTEIRFRYGRDDQSYSPASSLPGIVVLGAFTGGGSATGAMNQTANYYEFQNYTSFSYSRHFLKFGIRVRDHDISNSSTAAFNGVFTFPSLNAYEITEKGLQSGLTPQVIRADGGGASQFNLTTGSPLASLNLFDIEPYVEDNWKVRPNITLSGGLRFESQNQIHDHSDFAPRFGLAWGIGGKSAKTVLRAGYGLFYDRFTDDYVLNALRYNGINQQQYFISNPDFYPDIPSAGSLTATPTLYQIDSRLRAPYSSQAGIGIERQLNKNALVSVTYLNTHGAHQFISRNINAPDPANPGDARPDPTIGDLYQYESAGLFNQNQIITNFSAHASKVSLFGFYALSYADSNTGGASYFPMNSYDLAEDYGRSTYDIRHRLLIGGSWSLPKGILLFPFVVANSAPPFDITLGEDLNGDSIFNDRPAFASNLSNPANVVVTRWGTFDSVPVAGERIIPQNYGTGFSQFAANLRISKTFGFGRPMQGGSGATGGGPSYGHGGGLGRAGLSSLGTAGSMLNSSITTNRRYNLTLSVSVRNLFNNVNDGLPVGSLSSPIFGKPNALIGGFFSRGAANRRIDLQVRFNF